MTSLHVPRNDVVGFIEKWASFYSLTQEQTRQLLVGFFCNCDQQENVDLSILSLKQSQVIISSKLEQETAAKQIDRRRSWRSTSPTHFVSRTK